MAMGHNLMLGLRQLFISGDGLSWNSLPGFGAYYMISSIFVIIGLAVLIVRWHSLESQLILGLLLANLPILLIVTPNYNHWMFIHMPIILVEGVGLAAVVNNRKIIMMGTLVGYGILFGAFANDYFNTPRFTGTSKDSLNVLARLSTANYRNNYRKEKVYFQTNDPSFLTVVRDASHVSPTKFQSSKDHPYSQNDLAPQTKFLNYRIIKHNTVFRQNDYLITNHMVKSAKLRQVAEIQVNGVNYWVYKPVTEFKEGVL